MMAGSEQLFRDLSALRAHHAWTRDNIGAPSCKVRVAAGERVAMLDGAIKAILEMRREIVEECAKAAEAFDDPDRDWLRRSVWDEIKKDTAARIRRLATRIEA